MMHKHTTLSPKYATRLLRAENEIIQIIHDLTHFTLHRRAGPKQSNCCADLTPVMMTHQNF